MCLRTFDGDGWEESESCSWCHMLNPMDRRVCVSCGHEAHKSRAQCSCVTCAGLRQFYEGQAPRGATRRSGGRGT